MKEHIIIIGGGLGGLFTGAILSKEGYRITIFEKNKIIGGGLQSFKRRGYVFDTGMHILGGFRKNGSIRKLCTYLDIWKDLNIVDVDSNCMDSICFLSDKKIFKIAEGKEKFVESLAKEFPHEKENLSSYINAIYELSEEVDFFYLRKGKDELFTHSEAFLMPADKFIAKYITDKRLRDILGYMNPMYAGVANHTPAYIHALINVLYINGPSRFVGGSQQLADSLAKMIQSEGGTIYSDNSIKHIEVDNKEIKYIIDKNNQMHIADKYISAIHPCSLLSLMKEDAFPRSYRERLKEIPNTYSAFAVYIILKENSFKYINHTCYCQDDYGIIWNYGDKDIKWPQGFMYMTPPEENQGVYANKLTITSPMRFEYTRKWEKSKTGQRGKDYEDWKKECAEKLISKLEIIYPNFRNCIEHIYTASPLTIRDYYNVKEGSMYGYRKDSENITLSQVPIYTKIKNLLLTGQNINLHGICGVPLTAINTAEAIVGENIIVDKINKKYNEYEKD